VFSDSEHHEVRPRRSKQSLLQLLNWTVRANQGLSADSAVGPRDGFSLALRRAREVLRPGSLVVVLCDERALGDTAEQQLSLLARHTDLILMPLSDQLDHALPAAGLLRFTDRYTQLEIDTQDADLRLGYAALGAARQARWQRLAQKLCVLLMPLHTRSDIVEQIREHLQSGGRR
jgi:uncharacterized protein (DUF58 family)